MKHKIVSGKELFSNILKKEFDTPIIKEKDFLVVETKLGTLVFSEEHIDSFFSDRCVFIITKNADFTEGRGPMIFHKVFSSLEGAVDYVMSKRGIFGSEQRIDNYAGISIKGSPYCISGFSGYDIKPVNLENYNGD